MRKKEKRIKKSNNILFIINPPVVRLIIQRELDFPYYPKNNILIPCISCIECIYCYIKDKERGETLARNI